MSHLRLELGLSLSFVNTIRAANQWNPGKEKSGRRKTRKVVNGGVLGLNITHVLGSRSSLVNKREIGGPYDLAFVLEPCIASCDEGITK